MAKLYCKRCDKSVEVRLTSLASRTMYAAWCSVCGIHISHVPRDHFWEAELAKSEATPSLSGLRDEFTSEEEQVFVYAFSAIQQAAHSAAVEKGFWDKDSDQNRLSKLMLVVTELAEAAEGYRKPGLSDKIPPYSIQEEEIADAIIRLMDLAESDGMRIGAAIIDKLQYNTSRTYRHGGKEA